MLHYTDTSLMNSWSKNTTASCLTLNHVAHYIQLADSINVHVKILICLCICIYRPALLLSPTSDGYDDVHFMDKVAFYLVF